MPWASLGPSLLCSVCCLLLLCCRRWTGGWDCGHNYQLPDLPSQLHLQRDDLFPWVQLDQAHWEPLSSLAGDVPTPGAPGHGLLLEPP